MSGKVLLFCDNPACFATHLAKKHIMPKEKGCGKEIKLHPKVKANCGDYVMSWDKNVYCEECEEKFVKTRLDGE